MIARLLILVGTVIAISIGQTIFDLLFTGWVANHLEQSWALLPRNRERSDAAARMIFDKDNQDG